MPTCGCRRCRSNHERLHEAEPDPPTWHHLQTQIKGPLLLFAGRKLPHERLDLLVEAYHTLVTYLVPDVHLAMVGPAPVPAYTDVIQGFVEKLDLTSAWVAPDLGVTELAGFYRSATLFTSMSEDPGFAVEAVHALGFGVPVVARATGGLPETLGTGGLLLPADAGPMLMAEALAAVLEDGELRAALGASGQARLGALDPVEAEAAFLRHLGTVL